MISRIIKGAALAACLVAPVAAVSQSKDGEYAFDSEGYSWGQNAYFHIVYGVQNENGKVSVCGKNFVRASGRERTASSKAFKQFRVQLNGKSILKDISFFELSYNEDDFRASDVACKATDIDYPAKAEVSLRINKTRY